MTPYYQDETVTIYHGDCRDVLPLFPGAVVVSDPPYNVKYHYDGYDDNLPDSDYEALLRSAFRPPSVMLHYPLGVFRLSALLQEPPTRVVAWVYHSNTRYQWRMLGWFGVEPDFSLVKQPYKNQSDRRIRALMENGSAGTDLYDWWHVEQVKNVSREKTGHPCQIPVSVMERAVAVTPGEMLVDPFMGSGTTLVAAKRLGRRAVGIEVGERYCEIAARRLAQGVLVEG